MMMMMMFVWSQGYRQLTGVTGSRCTGASRDSADERRLSQLSVDVDLVNK